MSAQAFIAGLAPELQKTLKLELEAASPPAKALPSACGRLMAGVLRRKSDSRT